MDRIDHLIDNAYKAMETATDPWAKDYWQMVVNTLLRKYKRCQ